MVAMSQVCRNWGDILSPQVWKVVNVKDWHLLSFPITNNGESLPSGLRYTETFHWTCNFTLRENDPAIEIRDELSPARLAEVLQRIQQVATVHLKARRETQPCVLQALCALPVLDRLDVDLYLSSRYLLPFQTAAFMLSNLEKLTAKGGWHKKFEEKKETQIKRRGVLVKRRKPSSPVISYTPWVMTWMSIMSEDLAMVQFCPCLKYLEIKSSIGTNYQVTLLPLLSCKGLEELRLDWGGRNGFQEAIHGLQSIKKLLISHMYVEDLDLLAELLYNNHKQENIKDGCCDKVKGVQGKDGKNRTEKASKGKRKREGDEVQDQEQDQDVQCVGAVTKVENKEDSAKLKVLPNLESLDFDAVLTSNLSTYEFDQRIKLLVKRRKNLKSLRVGHNVNPEIVFGGDGGWNCKELEELDMTLRFSQACIQRQGETEVWVKVYRDLGGLPKLKVLKLRCNNIQKNEATQLGVIGGAVALKDITLVDSLDAHWARGEIQSLVTALPSLKFLNLGRVRVEGPVTIEGWLREFGRGDITLVARE
ncbi:hypothetical protein BG015_005663 [Linnemannia schmuckeri]|uniref:F-box domain-containing protein n=1 Tax=Linnemannia schmuckeri TaxID=64567 RepID=A0A9P5R4N2_9FUNG|nr:hypothetical protein BG015_005663 [Linnemannia schmuckeri]